MRWAWVLSAAIALGACGLESNSGTGARQCAPLAGMLGRMIALPDGDFVKGFAPVYPEEAPSLKLHVGALDVLAHEVTNDEFATFVAETGYVTDAERSSKGAARSGGSAVFRPPTRSAPGHWNVVRGATWKAPLGPGSTLAGKGRHPVVHVSLNDARRYAAWAGARLPTEVEWEYAAWSGPPDRSDALSGVQGADGAVRANIWHGAFPFMDTADDGLRVWLRLAVILRIATACTI